MKLNRKYELGGVPLILDAGKFADHCFYVGGFTSSLAMVDTRLNKLVFDIHLGNEAVTSIADSINDKYAVAIGDRGGQCSILDMKMRRKKVAW